MKASTTPLQNKNSYTTYGTASDSVWCQRLGLYPWTENLNRVYRKWKDVQKNVNLDRSLDAHSPEKQDRWDELGRFAQSHQSTKWH